MKVIRSEVCDVLMRGSLADLATTLSLDSPEWVVEREEVRFYRELGQGASAMVYKGYFLRETVAVKVMDFRLEGKADEREKLMNDLRHEFDIMVKMRSRHVVNLLGMIVAPRICMLLEYCGKGDLHGILSDPDFRFSWDLLFDWYRQALDVLLFL